MSSKAMVAMRDVHKDFVLKHTGASIKSMILWWRKPIIEYLHVLDGVSFEIQQGECVAFVGRNGAGKSTLLSLLANVVKPTSGSVEIHGRVAPLLELGAGFHPELTGIENILFNGMILGLTRKEVIERTDEIVAFAELERQIDLPVRTYSSGMLARLGFATAMHVDAEILIVDEALAVGDFAFERKCVERIKEFQSSGGTILFVSHVMTAVEELATRAIWLKSGKVQMDGAPQDVIHQYLTDDPDPTHAPIGP